jgi:hypothetical protein
MYTIQWEGRGELGVGGDRAALSRRRRGCLLELSLYTEEGKIGGSVSTGPERGEFEGVQDNSK